MAGHDADDKSADHSGAGMKGPETGYRPPANGNAKITMVTVLVKMA
ncbi:hypothetical protein [Acetobacter malorum]|nr:hypothetical protein [Acetobacter malorum]